MLCVILINMLDMDMEANGKIKIDDEYKYRLFNDYI